MTADDPLLWVIWGIGLIIWWSQGFKYNPIAELGCAITFFASGAMML
jgi:hypothetical protein